MMLTTTVMATEGQLSPQQQKNNAKNMANSDSGVFFQQSQNQPNTTQAGFSQMAGSFSNSYNTNAPFSPETPFGRVPKESPGGTGVYFQKSKRHQIKPLPQPLGKGNRQIQNIGQSGSTISKSQPSQGNQQDAGAVSVALATKHNVNAAVNCNSGNDFIPRQLSRLNHHSKSNLHQASTPQKDNEIVKKGITNSDQAPYPNLIVTNTPTKLLMKEQQLPPKQQLFAGVVQLKQALKKPNNDLQVVAAYETPAPQREQKQAENSSASSYFPKGPSSAAETWQRRDQRLYSESGRKGVPPLASTKRNYEQIQSVTGRMQPLHITKRTTQVSQLLQSANPSQRMVEAYQNISKTLENSDSKPNTAGYGGGGINLEKSISTSSISMAKQVQASTTVRGQPSTKGTLFSQHVDEIQRKPPQRLRDEMSEQNNKNLRKILGSSMDDNQTVSVIHQLNHWKIPCQSPPMKAFENSVLTANNRLATLKKEQLQKGYLQQNTSQINEPTTEQSFSFNKSTHEIETYNKVTSNNNNNQIFSPIKIVSEDDERRYLIYNYAPQSVENLNNVPPSGNSAYQHNYSQMSSGSIHGFYQGAGQSFNTRAQKTPNKNESSESKAYNGMLFRDGSIESIQSVFPTSNNGFFGPFDQALSGRRSIDGNFILYQNDVLQSGKGVIAQQMQNSLVPSSTVRQQTSEGQNKPYMAPYIHTGSNSAVQRQAQIFQKLKEQQQLASAGPGTIRGNGSGKPQYQKRTVLGGGSSHFRHSSNSVKKALIAQAGGGSKGPIVPTSQTNQRNTHQFMNGITGGASIDKDKKSTPSTSEAFQYKVVPSLSYETANNQASAMKSTLGGDSPSGTKHTIGIHATGGSGGLNLKMTGMSGMVPNTGKKFGKFNAARASNGFDDIHRELQSIMEKERILTDEIIKNSLVKQNGRFNFEALAHLNDIIESKKSLKKRFGVEGLSMAAPRPGCGGSEQQHCLFIKSYSESQDNELYDKILHTDVIPHESQTDFSFQTGLLQGLNKDQQRLSDAFLKNHYKAKLGGLITGTSIMETSMSPKASDFDSQNQLKPLDMNDPARIFSVLNGGRQTISQSSCGGGGNSLSIMQQTGKDGSQKKAKKKKSPRESAQNAKNKPRIIIYHTEEHSKKHAMEHPINKAIQKINYIIRLIFKFQNQGRGANAADSQGNGSGTNNFDTLRGNSQGGTSPQLMMISQTANVPQSQQTLLQMHQVEEQRLQEVQRVACKWFGIALPIKKLESKTALREYFQSREFTSNLRTKMNQILHAAINKSNGTTDLVQQYQQQQQSQGAVFQRFFVGWGNNDAIVRSVLKQRPWWQQYNYEDFGEVSFMWTQWKKQSHIDFLGGGSQHNQNDQSSIIMNSYRSAASESVKNRQKAPPRVNTAEKGFKLYNRMEQNKQLTNKKGVFLNMRDYYYMTGKDPFEVLPLTFLIKTGKGHGETDFQRFQLHYQDVQNQITFNDRNRILEIERRIREIRNELQKKRKDEQAAKAKQVATSMKKGIGKGASKQAVPAKNNKRNRIHYYGSNASNKDEEEPEESDVSEDEEMSKRQEEERKAIEIDEKIKEIRKKYPVEKNIWIVKPGENTNRGNGINVCSELTEIRSLVLYGSGEDESSQDQTFIIQRYIDNPLLINGRKFDFRCYGTLTSINGHLKGYFYEDAYIRTSCKEFDIEDVHNKFIHLTNDAVQKFSQDYGKYENGNKLSLSDFQKYLRATHPELNVDVWRDIMPQIRKLVTDSYRSVYGKIDPSRLHNTFELFGYDFMLDENFKLYLIEVNTNPCLEQSCPLLARIIPEVLDNTFKIILDPIFPPPDQANSRKNMLIPQEIKYTLVFDEDIDGPELKKLKEETRVGSSTSKMNGQGQTDNAGAIGIIDEIESDQEEEEEENNQPQRCSDALMNQEFVSRQIAQPRVEVHKIVRDTPSPQNLFQKNSNSALNKVL